MVEIQLKVNGGVESVDVEPWVSVLDLLRERLGLTGPKKGCDQGACGAFRSSAPDLWPASGARLQAGRG